MIPALDGIQTSLDNRWEALNNLNFSPLQTTSELEETFHFTPPKAKDKEKETTEQPKPTSSQENLRENQFLENSTFLELSSIKPIEDPTPTPAKKRKRSKRKGIQETSSRTPLKEVRSELRKTRRKDPISYKEPSRKKKMRRE